MNDHPIWALERGFWIEGIDFYEIHLHQDALMIFPGMGIMDRAPVLDSLRAAPRWVDVQMTERRSAQTDEVLLLAYLAVASRNDNKSYRAYCGSFYVRRAANWCLIAHQQTPLN